MINQSFDGNRHAARTKAAYFLGGCIAGEGLEENKALSALEDVLRYNTDHLDNASKTVRDCLEAGKAAPIVLTKREDSPPIEPIHRPSEPRPKSQNDFAINRYLTEKTSEDLGLEDHYFSLVDAPTNAGKTQFALNLALRPEYQEKTILVVPYASQVQRLKADTIRLRTDGRFQ